MENKCVCCGRQVSNGEIVISEEKIFCYGCAQMFGTCAMCKNHNACTYSTDPINLPHEVVVQRQMGPTVVETVVKNPERIQATCIDKKCPCWSTEFNDCAKLYGICENYVEIDF